MSCRFEIARDSRMALFAAFRPGECCSGNLRRHYDRSRQGRTGDNYYRANEKPEGN